MYAQSCNKFEIRGNIKGLLEGEKVNLRIEYAVDVYNRDYMDFDSTYIKYGKFCFSGNMLDGPRMFQISFDRHPDRYYTFLLDSEKLSIIGSLEQRQRSNIVGKGELIISEGGKAQTDYISLKNIYDVWRQGIINAKGDLEKAYPLYLKQPNLRPTVNERFLMTREQIEKCNYMLDTYLREHLNNLALPYIASGDVTMWKDFPSLTGIYSKLDEKIKKSYYGQIMKKDIVRLAIGQLAPDFTLKTSDGNSLSLKNIASNTKYTLIEMSFTGCLPCKEQRAVLLNIYQKYHQKGLFDIIEIFCDKDIQGWRKEMETNKLPWHSVIDPGKKISVGLYNAPGFPFNILVDADGKIIATDMIGPLLLCKLFELLEK